MKKLFVSILLITLLLTTTVFGQAIEVAFNKVNIAVNGQKVTTDNILYNGVTYVPLRAVSELLDKEVTWDSSTGTAGINDKPKININTASKEELMGIIHIDSIRADEVIKLRKDKPFTSLAGLLNIKGIAEQRLGDILNQGVCEVK